MIMIAALVIALVSLTLLTRASGSSAALVRQPTLSPIQRLSLDVGGEGSSRSGQAVSSDSVARVGAKVGQVAGFCRRHS